MFNFPPCRLHPELPAHLPFTLGLLFELQIVLPHFLCAHCNGKNAMLAQIPYFGRVYVTNSDVKSSALQDNRTTGYREYQSKKGVAG